MTEKELRLKILGKALKRANVEVKYFTVGGGANKNKATDNAHEADVMRFEIEKWTQELEEL